MPIAAPTALQCPAAGVLARWCGTEAGRRPSRELRPPPLGLVFLVHTWRVPGAAGGVGELLLGQFALTDAVGQDEVAQSGGVLDHLDLDPLGHVDALVPQAPGGAAAYSSAPVLPTSPTRRTEYFHRCRRRTHGRAARRTVRPARPGRAGRGGGGCRCPGPPCSAPPPAPGCPAPSAPRPGRPSGAS